MTAAARDRLLVLLHHAKAEEGGWDADHERELTDGGHADARATGEWLHLHDIGVDTVLCSTATRTQQTAEGIWNGGCAETDIHYDRRIYNGSADALLDVVREVDEDADVVMVVGHAPGIPALASLLAEGEGSGPAHDLMSQGYPTSGIAVLHYAGRWADLTFGQARLERFHVGRAAH